MKKLTALLLAIMMTLSLWGCSLKPEILGTYQTEINISDSVIESFDRGTTLTDSVFSLKYYLTECKLIVSFTFREDGTYSASVDSDAAQAALQNFKNAVTEMIDDYLFAALKQQNSAYGFSVETRDDVAALVGISWEALCTSALGVTVEEYANKQVSDSFAQCLSVEYSGEGKYRAEDGKLYLSESLDTEPSEETYETYEISGDTITFFSAVNFETHDSVSYPYVLTAVN